MAGALSSERPAPAAHTTGPGVWNEASKDIIGVYRGKSQSRNENYDKSSMKVGVSVPRPSSPITTPRVNMRKRLRKG